MAFRTVRPIAIIVMCAMGSRFLAAAPSPLTNKDFILEVTEAEQWKPTQSQVIAAKAALLDYLSSDHPASSQPEEYFESMRPEIQKSIAGYALQYFGGLSPSGDKEILINALCDSFVSNEHIDPSKQLQSVNDGGSCFFMARYGLAEGKIVYFQVNGRA